MALLCWIQQIGKPVNYSIQGGRVMTRTAGEVAKKDYANRNLHPDNLDQMLHLTEFRITGDNGCPMFKR